MRTFEDRVKQFYREFPDLRPFVKFQSKEQSAHIVHIAEDENETWFREKSFSCEDDEKKNSNEVLFNTSFVRIGSKNDDVVFAEICTVNLNEEKTFISSLHNQFNLIANHITKDFLEELDADSAYYHEAAHVLSRLDISSHQYKIVQKIKDGYIISEDEFQKHMLREECLADSYATLRTIQDHGIEGINFAKFNADYRIINYEDGGHLTTFSIDRSVKEAVTLMQSGELKNKTPQELYELAQTIADKDEFLLEREQSHEDIKLGEKNEKGDFIFNKESWAYKASQEIKFNEKNSKEQKYFSDDLKSRFHMAVHRTFDLTNHENFIFSKEETYNGPWSDANAKYLHAREGDKVFGMPYSKEDLDEKEYEVKLYSKSLLRGLRKGISNYSAMMNYNQLKKIDDGAFFNVMNGLTKENGADQLRSVALEMLSNPKKFAEIYLGLTPVARKNRLAKMNGCKSSSVKPSTM